MLKIIKINKIYRNDTKKDGTKYVDKRGKPYQLVTILTTGTDGKEVRMSTIDYQNDYAELTENQSVELDITRNGEYINFKMPSEVQKLAGQLELLKKRVDKLEGTKYPAIDQNEANLPPLPF